MNAANSATRFTPAGERSTPFPRPAHLDSRAAERLFAELFDDAIRASERGPDASYLNASVGAACDVGESRVRAWRDPHGGRPLTAYRLLQLPEGVFRGVLERVLAARAEQREDNVTAHVAAGLVVASMGRALALLPRVGELDEQSTPRAGLRLTSSFSERTPRWIPARLWTPISPMSPSVSP